MFLGIEGDEKKLAEVEAISDRLGDVPRKISLKNGDVFECADNDAVDAFFDQGGSFFSRLTRFEASLKFGVIAVAACAVLIFGIFRYGLPALASVAASATPAAVLTVIDAGALDTVDRLLFSETSLDEARQQELKQLFRELAIVSGHSEPPLNLLFRDGGPLGANAVALPGGTIILTDQLEKLAENDDEIAGVLAHEIGHVELRHGLKQIYRVLGVAFMVSAIAGDSGQIVEDVIAQATLLESLSYSRQFEAESDRYSVGIMLEAGRDPLAFIDLLDRVVGERKEPDDTDWLATHPGTGDRRKEAERYVEELR